MNSLISLTNLFLLVFWSNDDSQPLTAEWCECEAYIIIVFFTMLKTDSNLVLTKNIREKL